MLLQGARQAAVHFAVVHVIGWRKGQHHMEVPAALTVPPILEASCSRLSITSAAVSCSAFRLRTRLPRRIAGRAAWREQVNAAGWLDCGVQTCRSRRVSEFQMILQLPQSCLEEAVCPSRAKCCLQLLQTSSWIKGSLLAAHGQAQSWPQGRGGDLGVCCKASSGCHLPPPCM